MKKIISLTLVSIMFLSLLTGITFISHAETVSVVADKGWENATYDAATGLLTNVDSGYSFKVNGSVISYNGTAPIETEEVIIPSAYNGTAITTIDKYILNGSAKTTTTKSVIISTGIQTLNTCAFRGLKSLESVVIPQTVNKMGTNIFMATGLKEVTIPDGVTTIDTESFNGCTSLEMVHYGTDSQLKYINPKSFLNCTSLKEIIIPDTVLIIGANAFQKCSSATILKLGSKLEKIGSMTFNGCSGLTSVHLPATLQSITDGGISQCSNVTEYTVEDGNTHFKSADGVLYSADMTTLYAYPAKSTATTYSVPSSITTVKPYAFSYATNLTEIIFSDNSPVTALPAYSFDNCTSLASVNIPTVVTSLGNYCFNYCSKLEEVTVPKGVTVIPDYCFIWCVELKKLTFLGEITEIKQFACGRLYKLQELTFSGKTAPALGRSPFYSIPKDCTVYYPAGGEGYTAEAFTSQFNAAQVFEAVSGAPSILYINISGSNVVGQQVEGYYDQYFDGSGRPESGSTYVFETSADKDFSEVTIVQQGAISSGETISYTLTAADKDRFIRFGVTPRNADIVDNEGETRYAVLANCIRVPVTKPVVNLTSPYYGYRAYVNSEIPLTATASCDSVDITKIEYYANKTLVAQSQQAPFDCVWTPSEAGTYEVYAIAYNSLDECTQSGIVSVKIYSLDESIEAVAAEKGCYDFNSFTDSGTYTKETGLVLPGDNAPEVTIGSNITVTSASAVGGNSVNDYSIKIAHDASTNTSTTLKYNLSSLDEPINNVMLEAEVATSSNDQTVYVFIYQTPSARMNTFQIGTDGTVGYYPNFSDRILKKIKAEDGSDLIMGPDEWHKFGLLLNFTDSTITFYFDGEELETADCEPYGYTSLSWAQIQSVHNASRGASSVYVDNMKLYQIQDSYITSVVTSLNDKSFYLTGSPVKFEGYSKDSRIGSEADYVEIYANDKLIHTTEGGSYSFEKSDLAPGHYAIMVKAIAEDGLVGYSQVYNITISAVAYPTMIADNMMLQRNKPIKLTGAGINGAIITVQLCGNTSSATVTGGTWQITLPPMEATKAATLTFTTSDGVITQFNNVAIGEVLLVSGQSNVQYTLDKFRNIKSEADGDYPDIRLYSQPIIKSGSPQAENPEGKWKVGTKFNCLGFSAIGFLTAKDYYLANNSEIPVGVIYAAYGGSTINSWVPNGAFANHPDTIERATGSTYFNATVAPWRGYTLGQVLWYQGESDSSLTVPYEHMLTSFIDGWRNSLDDPDLNMIVVMIPIFDYGVRFSSVRSAVNIREAEWNVSERLENVETVVAVDTGDQNNIHPEDKLPIAHRASLIMQHFDDPDNTALVWKSPSFESVDYYAATTTLTVTVKDAAAGLKTTDGQAPRGFKLAGDDRVFKDVEVTIENNKIIVDTSSVTGTPMLRYAWEDCPALADGKSTLNVVNSGDLPLAPFRTDREVYRFKTRNEDGTYSDPVNFSPIVRNLIVSDIVNSKAIVRVQAYDGEDSVVKTDIYCDNQLLGEAQLINNGYYAYEWSNATEGEHTFYAIATDEYGYTSINNTEKTVNPKKYTYTLKTAPAKPEVTLTGTYADGFTATSKNAEECLLVIACYNGNKLISLNISKDSSAVLSAEDVVGANTVKAFILKDAVSIDSAADVEIKTW